MLLWWLLEKETFFRINSTTPEDGETPVRKRPSGSCRNLGEDPLPVIHHVLGCAAYPDHVAYIGRCTVFMINQSKVGSSLEGCCVRCYDSAAKERLVFGDIPEEVVTPVRRLIRLPHRQIISNLLLESPSVALVLSIPGFIPCLIP